MRVATLSHVLRRTVRSADLRRLATALRCLHRGADPDRPAALLAVANRGRAAVHLAAERDVPIEFMRMLVDHGADVDLCEATRLGDRPLHRAIRSDNRAVARFLALEAGADLHAANRVGVTPLELARSRQRAAHHRSDAAQREAAELVGTLAAACPKATPTEPKPASA